MDLSRKIQIQVGIFLMIGVFVILASIFMLGADRALFKTYVHIHSHFDQVQGLNEGSVISLSGVVVGNVKAIEFNPENNMLDVVMKVEQGYANKITKSSQVEIRTQGALGDKYIFIIPGDPKDSPVENHDVLSVAKASDIIGIFSERGKDTAKIFDIINEIYAMMRSINSENRVGKIMSNMNEASENLNHASKEAKKFAVELNGSSTQNKLKNSLDRLESILTKIDRGQGTLGALVNDSSVHDQLKGFLGGSDRKKPIKSLIRTSIEKNESK